MNTIASRESGPYENVNIKRSLELTAIPSVAYLNASTEQTPKMEIDATQTNLDSL